MAKFKCILSNNVFEFTSEHDIKDMRKHPEYVEVFEDGTESPEKTYEDMPKRKPVVNRQISKKQQ